MLANLKKIIKEYKISLRAASDVPTPDKIKSMCDDDYKFYYKYKKNNAVLDFNNSNRIRNRAKS